MSGTVARSLGALGDALSGTANVNFDAGTLFIDGASNRVGIGIGTSTSLGYALVVSGNGGTDASFLSSTGGIAYVGSVGAKPLVLETNGSERMRFDTSGNVLIGVTTVGSTGISLAGGYGIGWTQSAGESIPNIFRQTSSAATVIANGYRFTNTPNGFASSFSPSYAKTAISCGTVAGAITFYADNATTVAAGTDVTPTERVRIAADGSLLVGKTTADVASVNGVALTAGACNHSFQITNNENWVFNNRTTGTSYNLSFRTNNSVRGNITVTDSGTTYNTSSDYRLKENITAIANAGERLLNLKPCRFNFINDPTRTVDGFLAHEAAEVVPEAVTGEKDAVNEDGSIKAQVIDHSKLVPLLTAALQEALLSINDLKAEVQTLKTKIAALESN